MNLRHRHLFLAGMLLAATGTAAGIFLMRQREETVFVAIRFSNEVEAKIYDPLAFSHFLDSARSVAKEPGFRSELARRLVVPADSIRTLHVEQFRCTSIIDASFGVKDPQITNTVRRTAFNLITERLQATFPKMSFELVN